MKQHKWHKEIKAWADGAEIESKLDNEYGQWFLCWSPIWNDENFIHRIKQQPKEPQYLYVYAYRDGGMYLYKESQMCWDGKKYVGKIKLEEE